MARELVELGHSVTIIAAGFDHFIHAEGHLHNGESWRTDKVDGIEYIWVRAPKYHNNGLMRIMNMVYFALKIWSRKSMYHGMKPDLIIGSSPTLFAAFGAERLAKRYHVPFVLEVRDIWPQSLVSIGGASPSSVIVKMLEMLERHLYRQAAHIVSLLPDAYIHMKSRGANPEELSWLPNGVKLAPVIPPHEANSDRPFVILYAGAHGLANVIDTILDAAALLQKDGWENRIHIQLIGNGPQKERLQTRAKVECLTNIEFRDQVPRTEVHRILSQADALVMTMRNTSLYHFGISPNKLYHYMASARPLIFAADCSNDPIKEANCGFTVTPENAAALAEAMKKMALLTDRERAEMGLRARAYVDSRHNIEKLARQLENQLLHVVTTNKMPTDIRIVAQPTQQTDSAT